jgi:iron complex transport system ATP-binding protein
MADIHPSRLYARNITVGYAQAEVLKDVDVTIPNGQITAVVGANGCGKSTLLRALARLIQPTEGTIHLGGKPIASMTSKSVAQQLAFRLMA